MRICLNTNTNKSISRDEFPKSLVFVYLLHFNHLICPESCTFHSTCPPTVPSSVIFLLVFFTAILLSISCTKLILLHSGRFKRPEFFSVHGDLSGEVSVDVDSVVNYLFCQCGIGQDDLAQLTLIFEDSFQRGLDVVIVVILEVLLVISEVPKTIDFGQTLKTVLVLLDLFPSD